MTGSAMGKSVLGRFVLGLGACIAAVLLAPILIGFGESRIYSACGADRVDGCGAAGVVLHGVVEKSC